MNNRITLKDFIKENSSLLIVAGVFAALTAFFQSVSKMVSFFSFLIFLLLFWEIWSSFPKSEEASTRLKIFEYFFMFLIFGVSFQFIYEYREVISSFLFLIFFVIYVLLITRMADRYGYYKVVRKIAEKYKKLDPLIRSGGVLLLIGISYLPSWLSLKLVRYLIDLLNSFSAT